MSTIANLAGAPPLMRWTESFLKIPGRRLRELRSEIEHARLFID